MKRFYYLLVLVCFSCVDDNDSEFQNEVDQFLVSFENEALIRGVDIEFDDLTLELEEISDNDVIGQCKSYSDGSRMIVLEENYWNDASYDEKEFLVFHELGHCILAREHNNAQNNNGVCISIMQSGTSGCRKRYNDNNREDLLDELFEM